MLLPFHLLLIAHLQDQDGKATLWLHITSSISFKESIMICLQEVTSNRLAYLSTLVNSSSADGYFLETGPLRFVDKKLTLNKGGWHEFADVVFCKDELLKHARVYHRLTMFDFKGLFH